jgi:hypothetical protein
MKEHISAALVPTVNVDWLSCFAAGTTVPKDHLVSNQSYHKGFKTDSRMQKWQDV